MYNLVSGTAPQVLQNAYLAGRKVRFWLDSGNQITGVFQAKNGKTIAVSTRNVWKGHESSAVYYGMDMVGSWNSHGGMIATIEEMNAYRARRIAEELEYV